MDEVKCLNPWDVQSKHIVVPDGISESICAGEKRWGALPPNVCYEVQMDERVNALNSVVADSYNMPVAIGIYDSRGNGEGGCVQH